jgi:hypothetical protein
MVSACGGEPTPKTGHEGSMSPDRDESLIAAFERVAARMRPRVAIGSKIW